MQFVLLNVVRKQIYCYEEAHKKRRNCCDTCYTRSLLCYCYFSVAISMASAPILAHKLNLSGPQAATTADGAFAKDGAASKIL